MNKQRILVLFTIITLFTSCISSLEKTYAFNDGPWLVKQDTTNKYIISWLTSTKRDSTIYWGDTRYDLKNKHVSENTRIHRLELENLSAGRYYYTIVENLTNFPKGHVFSFNIGYPEKAKIAILGDIQVRNLQSGKMSKILAEQIARENPDAVIQMGDLVEVPRFNISWNLSLKSINLFSGERPYFSTAGNHEQINKDFVNYKTAFPNDYPNEEAAYYSFAVNNAFFISMDYCDDGYKKVSAKQQAWVEQEIINAKKRNMKWIFILFHGNILDTHPFREERTVQKWLIPLADKYEIDGIFTAHSHGYQHWQYSYGHDGYLFNKEDEPTGKEINYWCTAAGGAVLHTNYGLLTSSHKDQLEMYNTATQEYETIDTLQSKWNSKNYIDHRKNIYFGQPFIYAGKHFFHDPEVENYSNQNERFGFQYGEQTTHYMLVQIDGEQCQISAHYSDGNIISGPNGDKPQVWVFDNW